MNNLEKVPPHSQEAEEALIGSILIDNNCLLSTKHLKKECFYFKLNGEIFEKMHELLSEGMDVDLITLQPHFTNDLNFIAECSANVITSSGHESYARKIKECSDLRKILKMCQKIQMDTYAEKKSIEVLKSNKKQIDNIITEKNEEELIESKELNNHVVQDYVDRIVNMEGGGVDGYDTGFKFLKFNQKELITLVAHSGNGKSILAQNIAVNISQDSKVIFFSFEMSKEEIMYRIYSMLSGIPLSRFTFLKVTSEEIGMCADLFNKKCPNLRIFDKTVTIEEVMNICEREKIKHGLDFIVIDYIQITADKEELVPKTQKVTRVAKQIAQNLNIGVLQLSQFNRDGAKRVDYSKDNKMPTSHDILGGESVKQNSNQVYILHNETLAKDYTNKVVPYYVLRRIKGRNSADCKNDIYLERKQDCMKFNNTDNKPYWL